MPEVHVHVRLASTVPSPADLAEAFTGIGQVVEVVAGGGQLDVYARVEHVDLAIACIEEIVERLGLTGRTDVLVKPPTIKVLIECPEHGFPEGDDLVPRDALLRAIEAGRIGRWTLAGQQPGLLDVWIEVKDAAEAVSKVQAIVTQLGIGDRTRILAE